MGILRRLRIGRQFTRWFGDDVFQEELLCAEMFYYIEREKDSNQRSVAAAMLTTRALHLAAIHEYLRVGMWRKRIPIESITWLDITKLSDDKPWVLYSSDLSHPMTLWSTGYGTRMVRLLINELLNLLGFEAHVRIGDQVVAVEFYPWRPGFPAGWYAKHAEATAHLSNLAIKLARLDYRGAASGTQDESIVSSRYVNVPPVLDNSLASRYLLQYAFGYRPMRATSAYDSEEHAHAVALIEGRQLGIVPVPRVSIEPATPPPAIICPLSEVDVAAGLYSADLHMIYLNVPGYPTTVAVDESSLDGDWDELRVMAVQRR